MPAKSTADPQDNFPAGLSQPARRALAGAGYTKLKDLTKASEADLMKLHGFGPHGLELLRQALKERGWSFAEKK